MAGRRVVLSRREQVAGLMVIDLALTWIHNGSGILDESEVDQWNLFSQAVGHRSVVVREPWKDRDGNIMVPVRYELKDAQTPQCPSESRGIDSLDCRCSLRVNHESEHISFDHGDPRYWDG